MNKDNGSNQADVKLYNEQEKPLNFDESIKHLIPKEGLEMWFDITSTDYTTNNDGIPVMWPCHSSCSVPRALTMEYGSCKIVMDDEEDRTSMSMFFDYNHSMMIEPPFQRGIQTIISVHKFNPSEKSCHYIFSGTDQSPFHGDSSGMLHSGHGEWAKGENYQNCTIRINGNPTNLTEVMAWYDDFKLATVICDGPVPSDYSGHRINRIGRDRVYHEFNGNIKELIVYNRRLDMEEIIIIEDYLKNKYSLFTYEGEFILK